MKNISMEEMKELYKKSFEETFNAFFKKEDIVDKANFEHTLLIKGFYDFNFSVSLNLINKYLEEITKK